MTLNSDLQIRNNFSNTECKRKYFKKASNRKMFGDGMDRGSTSSGISNIKRNRVPSPYLNQAMIKKTLNRQYQRNKITDNRTLVQKSLPIHKANSYDISKSINARKKVKKSVLTLPNNTKMSNIAQVTVSDMNDSEYDNADNNKYNRRLKKRSHKFSRQTKTVENENYQYYDRDELYCTQLDFDVSRSSADLMNKIDYGKRIYNNRRFRNNQTNKNAAPCNIWALLKHINPFPFRPSPAISEESIEEPKKRTCSKKLKRNRGPQIYKKRQTEEFTYVSSVELNSSSPSFSRSSSFDRVTVINNHNTFDSQDSLNDQSTALSKSNRGSMKYNNKPIVRNKKDIVKSNYRNSNYCDYQHIKPPTKIIMNNHHQRYFQDKTNKSYDNESLREDNKMETYSPTWKSTRKLTENKQKMSPKSSVRRVSETKTSRMDDTSKTHQDQKERKLRLVTTMPSSSVKMTQHEIKKRLMLLKFPIVILGKDQVSSTFRVENSTPVQFSGLDKQIWPFMRKWTDNGVNINHENEKMRARNNFISQQLFSNNVKQYSSKSKGLNENTELIISERTGKFDINKSKSRISRFGITDKVIDLLYKRSSESTVYIEADTGSRKIGTDNDINVRHGNINEITKSNTANTYRGNVICINNNTNNLRQVWSKSKCSSDFINTIMMKMNEGVYFNDQMSDTVNKALIKHLDKGTDIPFISKDVFVQTRNKPNNIVLPKMPVNVTTRKELREHSIPLDQFHHILGSISGFDRPSTNLKIECLREDQVVVKHCTANVLIEFDVSGEDKVDHNHEADALKIAHNFPLPLTTIANNVYKCKGIILNKKLPEQLCTLLPNIMGSIMKSLHKTVDSIEHFQINSELMTIPQILAKQNNFCSPLSSIHVNRNRCTDIVLYNEKSQYNKILKNISLYASRDDTAISEPCNDCNVNLKGKNPNATLKYTTDGVFSNKKGISHNKTTDYTSMYKKDEYKIILKKNINFNFLCSPVIFKSLNYAILNTERKAIEQSDKRSHIEPNTLCTSIVPYYYDKKSNFSNNRSNIERVIQSFWNLISNNIPNGKVPNLYQSNAKLELSRNLEISNDEVIQVDFSTNEPQNTIPSNELSDIDFKECNHELKGINDTHNSFIRKFKTKTVRKSKKVTQRRKYRRKEKNSGMTNIVATKSSNVSLNTVKSIDDFFHIIGIKRSLLNIFDGQYAEKILTTLALLRKWTEDITPNQAFLIFLLINKNESQNLVRFRSIILQGIAMNRITHITELDMEIEVIEKENLNKWREYEEISSLQLSVENNDNLVEELCWIAKTTAADHQKPFDENSKKLIKSLVAKRKTLNPTYLRLMSRYVGLGLLKPQGKYGIKPFKQSKMIVKE